jgi:hypothetical protein
MGGPMLQQGKRCGDMTSTKMYVSEELALAIAWSSSWWIRLAFMGLIPLIVFSLVDKHGLDIHAVKVPEPIYLTVWKCKQHAKQ